MALHGLIQTDKDVNLKHSALKIQQSTDVVMQLNATICFHPNKYNPISCYFSQGHGLSLHREVLELLSESRAQWKCSGQEQTLMCYVTQKAQTEGNYKSPNSGIQWDNESLCPRFSAPIVHHPAATLCSQPCSHCPKHGILGFWDFAALNSASFLPLMAVQPSKWHSWVRISSSEWLPLQTLLLCSSFDGISVLSKFAGIKSPKHPPCPGSAGTAHLSAELLP